MASLPRPSRRWLRLAAAAVAVVALLAWAFAPRPVAVETAVAASGRFETTLDEDARTRVTDRYTVSAPLAGRLERPSLREGDAVAQGDAVARLAPVLAPMLDARQRTEQQARIDAAATNVHRARTRVSAARIATERARLDLARSDLLAAQGFVAPTRLESDRLALRAAEQDLAAAEDGQRIAQAELAQARAALAALRGPAGPGSVFTVQAPVGGRVLKLHQSSEGTVALGSPLLDLGDTRRLEVVAELLTTDALQARPGRTVRIERWGGDGTLEGRVRRVEPAAFTKVSALGVEEQRVRVLIDLVSPPDRWTALGDGFGVGVRIVTREAADALQVPVAAVFPRPGAPAAPTDAVAAAPGAGPVPQAVFVLQDGRARLRPVTVAARNATAVWIADGLVPGDTVIVYPPAAVGDGTRVSVRRP